MRENSKNAGEIRKNACVRQENTQNRPQARIMRGLTTCGDLNGKEEADLDEKQKDWRKTKAFSELKRDLEGSLQARGMVEQVYRDKVAEYLDFWVLHQELKADIKARGLTVTDDRGRESENRSVSLSIQVSRQMLNIYTALGFKSDAPRGGDPDDEL